MVAYVHILYAKTLTFSVYSTYFCIFLHLKNVDKNNKKTVESHLPKLKIIIPCAKETNPILSTAMFASTPTNCYHVSPPRIYNWGGGGEGHDWPCGMGLWGKNYCKQDVSNKEN